MLCVEGDWGHITNQLDADPLSHVIGLLIERYIACLSR